MAGKGDKWRKDVDYKKYWTNFPVLSGEYTPHAKEIKKNKGKTTYKY